MKIVFGLAEEMNWHNRFECCRRTLADRHDRMKERHERVQSWTYQIKSMFTWGVAQKTKLTEREINALEYEKNCQELLDFSAEEASDVDLVQCTNTLHYFVNQNVTLAPRVTHRWGKDVCTNALLSLQWRDSISSRQKEANERARKGRETTEEDFVSTESEEALGNEKTTNSSEHEEPVGRSARYYLSVAWVIFKDLPNYLIR